MRFVKFTRTGWDGVMVQIATLITSDPEMEKLEENGSIVHFPTF